MAGHPKLTENGQDKENLPDKPAMVENGRYDVTDMPSPKGNYKNQ